MWSETAHDSADGRSDSKDTASDTSTDVQLIIAHDGDEHSLTTAYFTILIKVDANDESASDIVRSSPRRSMSKKAI